MKMFCAGCASCVTLLLFVLVCGAESPRPKNAEATPISFHIGQDDASIIVFGGGGAVKGRKLNQLVELLNTAVDVINSEDGVNGIKVPSASKEKPSPVVKVVGLVRQSPGRYLVMMKTESNSDADIEITRDAMSSLEKLIGRKIDDENGITEALEYDGPVYPVTRNIDTSASTDRRKENAEEFPVTLSPSGTLSVGRNPNRRGTAPVCDKE